MKNTIMTLGGFAVVGYGISGIVFFAKAGSRLATDIEQRELFLYAGITCATFTALILIVGLLASHKSD